MQDKSTMVYVKKKKGSKGSYMCVYSQEETEAARRHANKKRR